MPLSFKNIPPKILLHNANNFGGGHYRILQPARTLRASGYAITQCLMHPLDDRHLSAMAPNSVVFQHVHTEGQIEAIKRYRKTLKDTSIIYEIDDVFWEVPADSVHANRIPPDIKTQMAKAMKLCNAITVTTPTLAEIIAKVGATKDIRVLPNQLPRWFINAAIGGSRTRERKDGKKIRIGWAGGIGHTADLRIVAELMNELRDGYTWVFMGMVPPGVNQLDVEFHNPVDFEKYPNALGNLHLDIALAPLENNLFNRCKSDLRVLEYGAAGFAVVASDIGTYEQVPVMKVQNTVDGWTAAIRELAADPDRRMFEAEALHEYVTQHRRMELHLATLERAYLGHHHTGIFAPSRDASGLLATIGSPLSSTLEELIVAHFTSAQAAWEALPACDILYIRPGTTVSAEQAIRLQGVLDNAASVCPLSNDGVFPRKGEFSPMVASKAGEIDFVAEHSAACEPALQTFPSGPCVLLSGAALSYHGLPDEHRFATFEGALMDWGARAHEDNLEHRTATNVFVATQQPSQMSPEYTQAQAEHTASWTPSFLTALSKMASVDPLAEAREAIDLAYHFLNYQFPTPDHSYADWHRIFDEVSELDCKAITADIAWWGKQPIIDVILPVFNPNPDHLAIAIESVMRQTYPYWGLHIADDASTDPKVHAVLQHYADRDERIYITWRETNGHICEASNSALERATGDWVTFLDHDDVLPPHTLYLIAREARAHPEAQFIYGDSDKIDPRGNRCDPYFTPDFNYELLLAQNYVCRCAYRTDQVKQLGGLRTKFEGSQDWDLVLRYIDKYCGYPADRKLIRHIPHIIYHWRMSDTSTAQNILAKPYALEAGRNAVLEHIQRTGQNAVISPHPLIPIFNMVRFLVPEEAPLVSIIIPTKDNAAILIQCIGSITQRTAYANYEIIIVDNGSTGTETRRALTHLATNPKIRILYQPGPFNYSKLNNRAVKSARGDYVCLLNDDTEIIEGAWLNDMVAAAMRPGVGAVGPKLIYPNRTVQQCGTIYNPDAPPLMSALHAFQRLPVTHPGNMGRALLAAEYIAVTGACLLIKIDRYLEIGGLNEDFPQDYNDVDFCLRLFQRGYRNLVLGHVIIQHHEGWTKRKHADQVTIERVMANERQLRQLWANVVDPYVNPNIMHLPNLDALKIPPPPKPWRDNMEGLERVFIINGTKDDAVAAYHRNQIAYCGTLDGHMMRLTYPQIINAPVLDLREAPEAFVALLGKLGIPKVLFCGIGSGTLGAVGFLTAVMDLGWPVEFTPTGAARGENPNDYIDGTGWQNTWKSFHDAARRATDLRTAAD